jgi:streptogramin lyase
MMGSSLGVALAADSAKVQVGEGNKIFPESMGAFADGTLFAGGTGTGIVYKAKPGATQATPLTKPFGAAPKAIFGVYADKTYGNVWACFSNSGKTDNPPPAILRNFDPETGQVKGSYPLSAKSFCNDITSARDGTVYVSDTSGGKIMRLAPGGYQLQEWFVDPRLAGIDGITLAPSGALYVNTVTTGKLFRLEIGADTNPGTLTELKVSVPLTAPDGMRFGSDGKLYLAENKAGQVDQVTISGDDATIKVLKTGYDTPTGVSLVGKTLWVSEEKAGARRANTDPVSFFMYPIDPDTAAK